jgi:hypothetical protein
MDDERLPVDEADGGNIGYHFDLARAGDVVYMLMRASEYGKREDDHHTHMVLRAQADMIRKGLHVRPDFPDFMGDISQFHERFQLQYDGLPRSLAEVSMPGETDTLFDFRYKFMLEELNEWHDEQENLTEKVQKGDDGGVVKYLELQLDALVDLTYVVLGTAYLQFGPQKFNEAWNRVHRANMRKVRAARGGDSTRGSTFDVVKPAGWTAPDHSDLVLEHAHITIDPVVETGGAGMEFMGTNQ